MEIRSAKSNEVKEIKKLIDSAKEMDANEETFSEDYYKRIIKKGIVLVAIENSGLIGACFGTYNQKEKWADFLGLVVRKEYRRKGVGSSLIKEFEKIAIDKKLKTIDLYSESNNLKFFKKRGYSEGRTYISFRKLI